LAGEAVLFLTTPELLFLHTKPVKLFLQFLRVTADKNDIVELVLLNSSKKLALFVLL